MQKPSDCFLQYQAGWGWGGEGSPPELFCFPFFYTVLLLFILYYHSVYPHILFCYPLPLPFCSSSSTTILLNLISLPVCSYSSFDVLFFLLLLLYLSALLLLYCSAQHSQSFLLPQLFSHCSPCLFSILLLSLLYCSVFPLPFLISLSNSTVLLPVLPIFVLSLSSNVLLFLLLCKVLLS